MPMTSIGEWVHVKYVKYRLTADNSNTFELVMLNLGTIGALYFEGASISIVTSGKFSNVFVDLFF